MHPLHPIVSSLMTITLPSADEWRLYFGLKQTGHSTMTKKVALFAGRRSATPAWVMTLRP